MSGMGEDGVAAGRDIDEVHSLSLALCFDSGHIAELPSLASVAAHTVARARNSPLASSSLELNDCHNPGMTLLFSKLQIALNPTTRNASRSRMSGCATSTIMSCFIFNGSMRHSVDRERADGAGQHAEIAREGTCERFMRRVAGAKRDIEHGLVVGCNRPRRNRKTTRPHVRHDGHAHGLLEHAAHMIFAHCAALGQHVQ